MTTGWLQLDITYSDAESNSSYKYTGAAFTDDEDQTRWFYFKSNGKKVAAESADGNTKDKTINGKKYAFDNYGAMVAEWSLNDKDLSKVNGYGDKFHCKLIRGRYYNPCCIRKPGCCNQSKCNLSAEWCWK